MPTTEAPRQTHCPCCHGELESVSSQNKASSATVILHGEDDAFIKARVELRIIECPGCGYRQCLDWEVLLDEHPENFLNSVMKF